VQVVGVVLFIAVVVVAAVFAAWLVAAWLQGGLSLESVHGGYLLPTVAAGFVSADVAGDAGLPALGDALFGVGVFFWIVMTVLLVLRLAFRPSLPDPLVPTMAILVAPPAVAGLAWFSLRGGALDLTAVQIAGVGVFLVLVQLALIPKYRRLKFSLGFWSFTFPIAAVVADSFVWLRLMAPAGWQVLIVVLLTALTAFVATIAVRSLIDLVDGSRRRTDERALSAADDADAAPPR
jgi:tellurite resistance protein